jgi:hypothetical protein
VRVLGLEFFPLSVLFRTIRTHVLAPPPSGDAIRDRETLLSALLTGNSHMANDYLADSRGFRFLIRYPGKTLLPGSELPFEEGGEIEVSLPEPGMIRLVRDSSVIHEQKAAKSVQPVDMPGVYRVEVSLKGRTWILGNSIYLR